MLFYFSSHTVEEEKLRCTTITDATGQHEEIEWVQMFRAERNSA